MNQFLLCSCFLTFVFFPFVFLAFVSFPLRIAGFFVLWKLIWVRNRLEFAFVSLELMEVCVEFGWICLITEKSVMNSNEFGLDLWWSWKIDELGFGDDDSVMNVLEIFADFRFWSVKGGKRKSNSVFDELYHSEWISDELAFYRLTHVWIGPMDCWHMALDLTNFWTNKKLTRGTWTADLDN